MSRFLPSVAPDIRAGHKADLKAMGAVMPYLWPSDDPGMRWRVVLSFAILLLTAILNALLPVLFAVAIDRLTPDGTSMFVVAPVALLLGYGFIFWFSRALNELRWILFGPLEQRVRRRLGLAVFDHLHTLSLRYHLSRRTGMLSRVQERGLEATAELLFNLVFVIAPLITEIVIITAVVLARFEAHFALIMGTTLSLFLFAVVFGSEILRRYQRPAVIKASEAHGKAIDTLINYETVKYFGNEQYVSDRYDGELAEAERLTVRSLVFRSLLGVARDDHRRVRADQYLPAAARPSARTAREPVPVDQAGADRPGTDGPYIRGKTGSYRRGGRAGPARRAGHDPVRKRVLCLRSAPADPEEHQLRGRSRPEARTGRAERRRENDHRAPVVPLLRPVKIDGHDIRNATQHSVRAAIGVVPQDTVLFNEKIGENIAFGRPGATRDDVIEAAGMAQISGFIASLPDGFDTVVGERGLKLSGGEKQRVAIARAVLKRPRIFLFDEATSALDSHTEQAIQKSLTDVSRGSTTVVIAHRLSTVVDADQILFVEAGEIRERGSHLQLLALDGHYAALWNRQQRQSGDGSATAENGEDLEPPDEDYSIPAQ